MWTPKHKNKPCIMDTILHARIQFKGTVQCIREENVRFVNACRLWLKAIHVEDLLNADDSVNMDMFNGNNQCKTDLHFPHQPRLPDWVWKIWQQTLCKVFLKRCPGTNTLCYLTPQIQAPQLMPTTELPLS